MLESAKYLTQIVNVDISKCFGVEVESDMLDFCRKKSKNFYSASELISIPKKFDLITMWNVIEHMHRPKEILQTLIELLEPNGEIFVETPRYGALAKKLGSDWSHYIVMEHINLFSRSSIIKMFQDLGMHCISAGSFGANLFGNIPPNVKMALDAMAKERDFGVTQVLRFRRN